MKVITSKSIPMVEYLHVDEDGGASLFANECTACGALFFDRRNACARCGKVDFQSKELATTGVLRSFTIVHRAAPGVPAPYISAVVAIDGGGVIKSNLRGIEADPARVPLGGAVELVTFVAGTDDDGTEAIGFGFAPATKQPGEAS